MFEPRISRVLARFLVILGAGFLVCAAVTGYRAGHLASIPGTFPVTLPVHLSRKATYTATFTARHTQIQFVNIELRRGVPLDHAEARLERLSKMVRCRIERGGREVPVDSWTGTFYGKYAEAGIGRFDASSGSRYTVFLDVRQPDRSYDELKPTLRVLPSPTLVYATMIEGMVLGIGALLSGGLALVCLVAAVALRRSCRRSATAGEARP